MSYGLSDASDERKVEALEAQASDMQRVAIELAPAQPAAAASLANQAAAMKAQADAVRKALGLPPAGEISTATKVGLAVGAAAAIAGAVWLLRRPRH